MVKKVNKLQLLVIALLFMGCSINYDDESQEIEKSETIPDSVMENFKLVQIRDNKPYTKIQSSLAEIYDSQNKTILFDVEFTEYNTTTNELSTQGRADKIEYYNDSEDAKLDGNLNFISIKDKIKMTGDSLYWNSDKKSIESDIDSIVQVTKEDGSKIEGYGFSANLKNSTFSFEKSVTGVTK